MATKKEVKRFCVDGATHNFAYLDVTPIVNFERNTDKSLPREIKLFCTKCGDVREI